MYGSDHMSERASYKHNTNEQSAIRRATASAQRGRTGKSARTNHASTGWRAANVRQNTGRKAPRKRGGHENLKTALWLWCPPVGLSKMWRSTCTWPRGVKIGITAAMALILLAIFVFPSPASRNTPTGVQLVSGNPEVEVYGPALPSLIVPGYTRESTGSVIVDQVADDVHYVYAADDAKCYHEYECKFAFASSQRLTVYEAYHLGYTPCGRCNPPVYVPGETDPITAQPLHKSTAGTATTTVIGDDQATEQGEAVATEG